MKKKKAISLLEKMSIEYFASEKFIAMTYQERHDELTNYLNLKSKIK